MPTRTRARGDLGGEPPKCESPGCESRAAYFCTNCRRYLCPLDIPPGFRVDPTAAGTIVRGRCTDQPCPVISRTASEPPTTYQLGLDGKLYPPQGDDLNERVEWVLATYPETRGNDVALVVRCWLLYDGLAEVLGDGKSYDLLAWAWGDPKPTSPETYRRRRQEAQRLREARGALRPDPGTVARRRSKDGAGPPTRRRS